MQVKPRTYIIIPREPRCCANRSRSRREAQVIAVAIAKLINAERGIMRQVLKM